MGVVGPGPGGTLSSRVGLFVGTSGAGLGIGTTSMIALEAFPLALPALDSFAFPNLKALLSPLKAFDDLLAFPNLAAFVAFDTMGPAALLRLKAFVIASETCAVFDAFDASAELTMTTARMRTVDATFMVLVLVVCRFGDVYTGGVVWGCYEDCERLPLPKALGSIASAFFDGCRQNLIQY